MYNNHRKVPTYHTNYTPSSYLFTDFKDISDLVKVLDISEVLILQDCDEAYALLGSLLLQNQSYEYLLIKDTVRYGILNKYTVITNDGYSIEIEKEIYLTDDSFTFYLRGK